MQKSMNIIIGIIGLAAVVYLYKQAKEWWKARKTRQFVERTLAPAAGLTHFPEPQKPEPDWSQDVQC